MRPLSRSSRFLLIFIGILVLNVFLWTSKPTISSPKTVGKCRIADWNQVETHSVPNSLQGRFSRWLWMALSLSDEHNQPYTALSIMGAYVYPDHISISISAQYMVKQQVYCRYFDCQRTEIATWQSVVFPESVVHCPRKIGAEYVSVSKSEHQEAPTPVKLTFRVFEEPVHELAVCVAPIYGNEPKWLQLAEFVEHHKLEGATYFYISVGTISDYDRRILDYYENIGEVDVKILLDKYERPHYAWQNFHLHDCHLRSKYHSKWTAFIDLDERISTFDGNFVDLLRSSDNNAIAEFAIPILNIVKDQDAPIRFENEEQVKRDLLFERFTLSADPTWNASKMVIRSDKAGIMSTHYVVAKESGYQSVFLDSSEAVIRHYRSTKHRASGNNWHEIPQADGKLLKLTNRALEEEFAGKLAKRILETVKNVYEKVPVNCSAIPKDLWQPRDFPDPCEKMQPYW